MIKKVKKTVSLTYVVSILNGEEIVETFCEKELEKTNQIFRVKKVIKGRGGKLFVRWKGYENSCNGWIDKKRYKMSNLQEPYCKSEIKIMEQNLT